ASNPGDIIMDFFVGSGTTSAVAHKMGRQYIGIEQLDYIEALPIERLKNVISGEQSGVSKDYNWNGGGSFIYCELAKYNQTFADKILEADSKEKLIAVWQEMKERAFLSYQFDRQSFDERIEAFKTLSLDDQKKFLLEVLDKNQLHVNYSEIADETFGISKEDKRLNDMFYANI
ncbi:MAG: DNA methyltransferase, partial [Bacteroidales bacterium]|nr:DNA methyltransferase [Bacteroidales bacterium]